MALPVQRRGGGFRATVYREAVLLTRDRVNLVLSIAPTVVYLLILSASMGRIMPSVAYDGHEVPYGEFIVPTVIMSAILSSSLTVGTALFQEEMSRMSLEIWSYPLRRTAYFSGKIIAGMSMVLVQAFVTMTLAALVFDVGWSGTRWLALLLAGASVGAAVNCAYLLVATLIREFRRFMILGNISLQILLFASPSFYPQNGMAPLARYLSYVNPVTYGLDCMRAATLSPPGTSLAWCALMLCVASGFASVVLRSLIKRADNL
ncbi:ABC transporter permease [Kitasatospora viridis]|nr:ABC transporter permease [Kitasatospora viridis]